MNDVQHLIFRCEQMGAELIPTAHGTLKVKAPAPLPAPLQAELQQHKAEVLALLKQPRPFFIDARDDLPCPTCGASVSLEPARPEELPTRIWSCPGCQSWGASRDGCEFPTVWVSSRTLQ